MTKYSIVSSEAAQPQNARELECLSTATAVHPTIEDRANALALMHSRGHVLTAHGPSPAAITAWTARHALAAAAIRPIAASSAKPAAVARPAARLEAVPTKPPGPPAPSKPYAQQLRDALAGGRLTPAARAGIKAELARVGG